ncbi:MAG: hydantoinase/oxoprolinase family protein [Rhodospirillaceae bacterium]|jgi:N-methylhydantoinase A|nr:hydantoinase/oxoprolinase family protein [Rhodospirillaceae bacterium]
MTLRVAIDTGGTFTDVVAIDEESGEQFAVKVPSTPGDPSQGLLDGYRKSVEVAEVSESDVSQLLHGSTTATNAVLEHKFEGLGLIVSQGFRHIIEIARQSVPDGYGNSYFWVKPPRLVPLHLVRDVPGRMNHEGEELIPLDEAAVLESVDELVELGVRCLAVCLLHSYANAEHERRIGELIAEKYPDIFVSLSSVVLPEYREYERAMTTLIDVMVKPYCKTYLQHAANEIRAGSGDIPFLIMQSNGGVVRHETAGERPVTMLLSGPAAGVLGAVHMSRLAGFEDILTLDVGGTSTDVSLIDELRPQMTSHSLIENYPVKTPMFDIVTVAAGGGSIAWINNYDELKVGPQSAGAVPGPICYRRGGKLPAVTDAAVVMGRLPASIVGGELSLDANGARAAFEELGNRYAMPPEEAAAGVFEIATANMVNGIRQVTTIRGRDPQNYTLMAFGGAGGMFATDVAEFLGIRRVISPPNPGNLSAFGLHVSDVKRDYIKTIVRQQSSADQQEIEDAWSSLENTGLVEIEREGVAPDAISLIRSADARYVGEGHEVNVLIPSGLKGQEAIDFMWKDFHRVHDETFGFGYEGEQDVELVNIRVEATGFVHRPKDFERKFDAQSVEPVTRRDVYWRDGGWTDCAIYRREDLALGQVVHGPTVIEEYGSTLVVAARWMAKMDKYGNLILETEQ